MSDLIKQTLLVLENTGETSNVFTQTNYEYIDENVYDGPDQANAIKQALVLKHKDNNYNVRVNQKGQHVIDHAYYGKKKVKSQIKALGQ